MKTKITELFDIQYPIIQGGMVWCSGWRLASAVSNAGGLGLLGAGSMHPQTLEYHIEKMKETTKKSWGVNIPLLYPEIEKIMDLVIDKHVPIVFTSAGSPKKWTNTLKSNGIKVIHVVSSSIFAKKSEDAGVDAVVAEGFEAGGHEGREESTTFTLIPNVVRSVSIPVIAAGGVATGAQLLAALTLGAEGVQIGSRFAACGESSAHENYKQAVRNASEGDTMLCLKKVVPTRLLKNHFFHEITAAEDSGATKEQLQELLGRGRAKRGIFEGDLNEGELEIGQISSIIDKEESVNDIFKDILTDFDTQMQKLKNL